MMQSRLAARRLLLARPQQTKGPSIARLLVRQSHLTSISRPQLPFLSNPLARNKQWRYLTTERKRWLTYEVFLGAKYIVYTWAIVACLLVGYWSVQQEWLERRYPSPHEWRFITRLRFRLLKWGPDRTDTPQPNWVQIGNFAKNVLERLEDPATDGADLQDLLDGGIWIDGIGNAGKDITAKSEPWRRGYYEVLMLCAKAAEKLNNHLVDTQRHIVFPAEQVFGPSNPNPRPIPPGSPSAPHEKDCEAAYEAPETFYMKILTTKGFTNKQKMDAALNYGSWLDFKGLPDASAKMYEWALQLASENTLPSALPYNPQTFILQDTRQPSANILTTLTAMAAHKARNDDVSSALPILISILRARRSLPVASASSSVPLEGDGQTASPWSVSNILGVAKRLAAPPAYPAPPSDGEAPPFRDAKELCEEAGLNLYIGEIMYTTKEGSTGREDGLAWTREAVDLAEEQLHKLGAESRDEAAKKTCKECLNTGLENWSTMVARLAREEREKQQKYIGSGATAPKSGWFGGLWGEGQARPENEVGRWTAEEKVVKERTRRAQEILDVLEAPKVGLGSLFWA
ncbi:hypothetical protein PG989_015958 [Apiospora arundinis]|uniref:MFS maltose permease n=1 Tax=Apiospora arundinis TaxID=335852 RepID=A0ABR2JIA8_9PEZI